MEWGRREGRPEKAGERKYKNVGVGSSGLKLFIGARRLHAI